MAAKNARALTAARRFIRAVRRAGIHLEAAYLYGSYATGAAHADSDIDIALVSKDLTGWVDDLERLRPARGAMDSRIEHVRFHPRDFRDENPLVWEIKTTGIQLVGKTANGRRRVAGRPLKVNQVVTYWTKSAADDWHGADGLFATRDYPHALFFGRLYLEKMLKAVIVHRTRAHAPYRCELVELAKAAGLTPSPQQRDFLTRVDSYNLEPRYPQDQLVPYRKYTLKFCAAELKEMRKVGNWCRRMTTNRVAGPPSHKRITCA